MAGVAIDVGGSAGGDVAQVPGSQEYMKIDENIYKIVWFHRCHQSPQY